MIARGQDFDRVVITGMGLTRPTATSWPSSAKACWPAAAASTLRYPLLRPHRGRRLPLRRTALSDTARTCAAAPAPAASASTAPRGLADCRARLAERRPARRSASTSALPSTATSRPRTKSTCSKGYDYDTQFWSHHHNPRTVANNPAGEISLNLGITGPHYTIGAACAAGNAGIIQGVQMLRLGECDVALAGGVSESIHTFGIFASFRSQGALASTTTRPRPRAPLTPTATASSWPKAAACRARAAGRRQGPRRKDLRRNRRLRHEQRRQRLRAARSRSGRRSAFNWKRPDLAFVRIRCANALGWRTLAGTQFKEAIPYFEMALSLSSPDVEENIFKEARAGLQQAKEKVAVNQKRSGQLAALTLPSNPTKEQARAYVREILFLVGNSNKQGGTSDVPSGMLDRVGPGHLDLVYPEVAMLEKVGPENLDVLVEIWGISDGPQSWG